VDNSALLVLSHAFLAFVVVHTRRDLVLENLALRQQLALCVARSRPRARRRDRMFWLLLRWFWSRWREPLHIVSPDTVVSWHRSWFRWVWRRHSAKRVGRPGTPAHVVKLIQEMALANPLWGAPRIHGELAKIGIVLAQSTVARYIPQRKKSPSPSWRAFLENHKREIAAIDFVVVPTAAFKLLYGLIIVRHDRRELVHVAATEHPTAAWTRQQLREAFPNDRGPRFVVHDRDAIFEAACHGFEFAEVKTAPRSPWQNGICERLIGSIRRELLDHVIVLDEQHLTRLLRSYQRYYNDSRTHLSLAKDAPKPRAAQSLEVGTRIVAFPQVGGIHHRYERRP
jgi:transposase InsO family protein